MRLKACCTARRAAPPAPTARRRWRRLSATGYRPVQDILAKYNPGVEGQEFATGNAAKFIAAGSDIVFEVHYTATGKPETDRSSVGIVLADGPPRQRHLTTTAISARDFEIPAGAPNYEVRGETIVNEPAKLVWIQPHMHYRARNYELTIVYPVGRGEDRSARAELQVRLAGRVRARGADRSAQGHEVQDRCALRQLARQQVQPRPDEEREIRRAELG